MTKPVDPFSRVYWRLIDDEKFVGIYPDDAAFALWVRLLMAADMAWPASAALPFGTKKAVLKRLCDARLVDTLGGGRYRIHGLDAEREKRRQQAEDAAAARYNKRSQPSSSPHRSDEHPVSSAHGVPIQTDRTDRQKQTDSTLSARDGLPHITADVQSAGEAITGAGMLSAGERQLTELDRMVERHGSDAVIAAFRTAAHGKSKSWRQLVWDSVKVLEPFANGSPKAQREEDEATAARERSDRAYRATQERLKADPLYAKLRAES